MTFCRIAVLTMSALLPTLAARAACDANETDRTPISRYEIRSGEVYDRKTDLTWQRCSVGQRWLDGTGCVGIIQQITWEEAVGQAATGWRLPSRDELATLISPTCKNPAINEESFPDMDLGKLWYWSSTESGEYLAWLINFADGRFTSYDRTDVAAVRVVRSGK